MHPCRLHRDLLSAALDRYEEADFWRRTAEAHAALASDPDLRRQVDDETALWDNTLSDGLDDEPAERAGRDVAIDPPRRGDVWSIDLGTPVGRESGSRRYGLVMSVDEQNRYGLATVLPITQTRTGYPSNVDVEQGAGGLTAASYVQVEQVRTVSTRRFDRHVGTLGVVDLIRVERVLRLILTLP